MTTRETGTATARAAEAAGLRSIAELTKSLFDAVDPFVRYEPPARLALSVFATRPRVAHAEGPRWSAADGVARVELGDPGAPRTALLVRPGRLVVEDGFVTLRTRCRFEGAASPAALASDLLDAILGYVPRAAETAPETRLEDGMLVWERPLNRCEVLLVLQRALGRELAGDVPFRFVDDRIVLDLSDQEDPRWDTTGGFGLFDPWPFAVWLARRHLKLQRPALRVAIEPGRRGRPPAPSKPARKPARKPAGARRRPARKPAPDGANGTPAKAKRKPPTRR
jgi:hypothetical protein